MLTPEYIVGLTDGEGSFCLYLSNNQSRRNIVEFKFFLKLIEDDKEILYELKKYFGCGNVYYQKDTRPNHRNCYRYEVGKREDLWQIIVPFFRKYGLRLVSKRKDFELFATALESVIKKNYQLDFLQKMKALMHKSSPGAGNPLAVVGT